MTKKAGIAALLVLALALPACGGNGGVSAEQYASTLCTSLEKVIVDAMEAGKAMTDEPATSPEEAQDQIAEVFGDMSAGFGDVVKALEAEGAPDVENGEETHTALISALKNAQTAMADAQKKVEELDMSDPTTAQAELMAIAPEMQTAMNDAMSALDSLDSPDLDEAASKAEACTKMQQTIADANATV